MNQKNPLNTLLSLIAFGILIYFISNFFMDKSDIKYGTLFAGLLSMYVGYKMLFGRQNQVADTLGWWVSVGIIVLIWQPAHRYLFLIDVVLESVFGVEAVAYSGLVAVLILIWAIGVIRKIASKLLLSLIHWDIKRVEKVHLKREVEAVG